MYRNIDELDEEEFDELVEYSDVTDNLVSRYAIACQVIANMSEDLNPDIKSNDDMVDLTICKMLMDGIIEVENISDMIH
jgi:hypothetical protein